MTTLRALFSVVLVAFLFAALAAPAAEAATPPPLVNYQGVLRDAADKPRSGSFDMVFRFFDAQTAGNELLVDSHLTAAALAVTASNGLFNTVLGGGQVADGSGPGTYTSLAEVFRDQAGVWVQVEVGPPNGARETLTPRTRILASAYAQNATRLDGRAATEFIQTNGTPQTKTGPLTIDASGSGAQALSVQGDSMSSTATFRGDPNTVAAFGFLGYGVYGTGALTAGFFQNASNGAYCRLGAGDAVSGRYGISCEGADAGGTFQDSGSGAVARLAISGRGISAVGTIAGGDFGNSSGFGLATLGTGDTGISAYGAFPNGAGGRFEDSVYGGIAQLAIGSTGIVASGFFQGGEFQDTDSGNYARVGYDVWKILGTGGVSFVQNHPEDASKVIVYTAPEGAEAATYTRGSARVLDGIARVALDPTFAWTTNPDVGLTVTVTPRGPASGLYVESISTGELVVRCEGRGCADVPFDYLVWGLRIGFEEIGAVRPKDRDAAIPAMDSQQAIYAAEPSLREHSPLERFRRTERAAGIAPYGSVPDLARAASLRASVGVFDPRSSQPLEPRVVESAKEIVPTAPSRPQPEAPARVAGIAVGPAAPTLPTVAVAGPVEPGDVLAFDPLLAAARLSARSADPLVIGIVAQAEAPPAAGQAPIALAGTIASCRADATESPIVPGDLLVASAIPGHAMKAATGAPAGTIVAKALESLPSGTGLLRVLVMSR